VYYEQRQDLQRRATRVLLEFQRTLLVGVLLICQVGSPASAEQRLALVIGNGAYSGFPSLRNPPNDAALMADTLSGVGFDVTALIDADQLAMKQAIRDFGAELEAAGRDTVGLFYFAGHGVQARGVNYLIPLAAEIEREPDLEINAIPLEWVLAQAEAAGNRMNILILDACRDNPLSRSIRSAARGFTAVDAPRGTLIAYATAPGSVALDGTGRNSPYTEALSATMQEPGLVLETAFRQVRVRVMEQTGDRQVPWENSSLTGEFYFAGQGSAAEAPAAVVATPAPAQPGEQSMAALDSRGTSQAADLLFWDSIKDSDRPELYQDYLRRFPDGLFAAIARARLAAPAEDAAADPAAETAGPARPVLKPAVPAAPAERPSEEPAQPPRQVAMAPVVRQPPRQFEASDLAGRWEGDFRCQQDLIGMALEMQPPRGGRVDARFEFFPTGSSPSFPSGSFAASGSFDPGSRSLRLQAGEWIDRPWGFQRHDLSGTVQDDGTTIEGRVLTTGCTGFRLRRLGR
jgi:uncharacterized caspase-like protein